MRCKAEHARFASATTAEAQELEDAVEEDFVETLRNNISINQQNLCLISGFMCALAGAVYSNPPEEGLCLGDTGVIATSVIQWFAMGFFFLTICGSVLLASDIDGVPDMLLVAHLQQIEHIFGCVTICTAVGMWLIAIGYGIDIGERNGCLMTVLGLASAPVFPAIVTALFYYLRSKRLRLLKAHHQNLGRVNRSRKFRRCTTWMDRIPQAYFHESSQISQRSLSSTKRRLLSASGILRRVSIRRTRSSLGCARSKNGRNKEVVL